MSADGRWSLTLATGLGRQAMTLSLSSAGAALAGTFESMMGSGDIEDGALDGDRLTWKAPLSVPTSSVFTFVATIDGDAITGTVDNGGRGTTRFTGTRIDG
jgi:hypothetical protein